MIEIGKDVVCINTHIEKWYTKHKVYPCVDLKLACKCNSHSIDIGLRHNYPSGIVCHDCGTLDTSGILWGDPEDFRNIDDVTPDIEEIIKQFQTEVVS